MGDDIAIGPNTATAPVELSPEFFAANQTSYSARLFDQLSKNPLYEKAIGARPSASKMLTIATVVISAMDQKIQEDQQQIERSRKEMSRFRQVFDGPLFKPALPAPKNDAKQAQDPEKELSRQEWTFFQRYFTLRNISGATVIALGMIGSVLAFLTSDFKGRAEAAEAKVGSIERNAKYWQEEGEKYRAEAEKWRTDAAKKGEAIARLGAELKAAKQEKADLEKTLGAQVNDLKKQVANLSAAKDKAIKEAAEIGAQLDALKAQSAAPASR